jgi:fermentation-respiration switch protein FrsA (DUF1100 family)
MKKVKFRNRDIVIAGILHTPEDFDEAKKYSAIVLSTPGSSVKEQIGSIYASNLAKQGFVALTFDPSYQGESTGEPRDLEDPAVRAEDIRCACDYLTTLSFIDEKRLGLLGICAGGGYAIHAALTDHRFKAVGTVVAIDIGRAFRSMLPKEDLLKTLLELGKQRTAEARGNSERRDPWIPDSLKEAKAAGLTDPETLEAVDFYRESSYKHPNSTNRLLFRSYSHLLSFDGFNLVPDLLIQPLQVVVGGRRGTTGQYEAGEFLFKAAPNADKDFFVVEDAGHYEMYFKPEYVGPAVKKLSSFFLRISV